jgi:hypothetical protein
MPMVKLLSSDFEAAHEFRRYTHIGGDLRLTNRPVPLWLYAVPLRFAGCRASVSPY